MTAHEQTQERAAGGMLGKAAGRAKRVADAVDPEQSR
jgi:hypothetical protein